LEVAGWDCANASAAPLDAAAQATAHAEGGGGTEEGQGARDGRGSWGEGGDGPTGGIKSLGKEISRNNVQITKIPTLDTWKARFKSEAKERSQLPKKLGFPALLSTAVAKLLANVLFPHQGI